MNVPMRCLLIVGMAIALTGCGGEPEPLPPEVVRQESPPAEVNVPAAPAGMPDTGAPSPDVPGSEQPAPAIEPPQPAGSEPAGGPPGGAPQPPSAPASPPPAAPPASPPPAKPPQPPTKTPQPAAAPSIDLSAGVALPQSLPMGTAMGMSVDYEFTAGQPQSSQRYVWVIKPATGNPVKQPVRLSKRGTLQAFFPQLRPRNGPFETHIEGPDGSRISNSVALE